MLVNNLNYLCKLLAFLYLCIILSLHSSKQTTVYWFKIDGTAYDQFDTFAAIVGVSDCNGHLTVVDVDGYPVLNEYVVNIVLRECKITDEMIMER